MWRYLCICMGAKPSFLTPANRLKKWRYVHLYADEKLHFCERQQNQATLIIKAYAVDKLRPQKDYAIKKNECFRLTKKPSNSDDNIKPDAGPVESADSQETQYQYCEGEGDDPVYPRTATPVKPGFSRHQPHLMGPGLLQRHAALPRDVGHGGRSSGSREDQDG
ncbi:hypothetical protein ACN38_g10386 [Penicillium nordicum]|uniref:Uncharacterized protein n=1 Tax=Penicillium nordicum TaxID=229535 RepID=A0A0N0RXV1_9EURO|nr:hypothetical protein ACN38_g10386 [Penicillium nordicum]